MLMGNDLYKCWDINIRKTNIYPYYEHTYLVKMINGAKYGANSEEKHSKKNKKPNIFLSFLFFVIPLKCSKKHHPQCKLNKNNFII